MESEQRTQRAIEVWVRGRVQGVGFRWRAQRRAEELGLGGWVTNLPDGGVRVWVEGAEQGVAEMEAWLRKGPAGAQVEEIDLRERTPMGYGSFEIRSTRA